MFVSSAVTCCPKNSDVGILFLFYLINFELHLTAVFFFWTVVELRKEIV